MLIIFRLIIVLIFFAAGLFLGRNYGHPVPGALAGAGFGVIALVVESLVRRLSLGTIIGGLIGLAVGLLFANLFLVPVIGIIPVDSRELFRFAVSGLLGWGGLVIGLKKGQNLTVPGLFRIFRGEAEEQNIKLLDTSVIIDGRIADICELGFIEGSFIIPQFILQELQHIADSPDPLKRARGRRGLDILHRMQKMATLTIKIVEEDFPKIKEVDSKLVALAKTNGGKIITNDFNLNKVAELQGISVLNINELANVLKPVVLPGETMSVFIIKEGKESNQGVAYLDDGTMVVVDNGRRLIGKHVDVAVTSVLQTTAGRMIFTKTKEDYEREEVKAVR
ncbi:MAG: TRAM domain-containing protein [Nitrospiraceae bacterium]|nr:TRAM domain-containing protein [Nitrospiraceae bacterium]